MAFQREITANQAALAAERHINFNATLELWRVSWQEIQCYVGGNNKITAVMITGTIDDEQNMPPAKFLG